jgi:hypothetical protein
MIAKVFQSINLDRVTEICKKYGEPFKVPLPQKVSREDFDKFISQQEWATLSKKCNLEYDNGDIHITEIPSFIHGIICGRIILEIASVSGGKNVIDVYTPSDVKLHDNLQKNLQPDVLIGPKQKIRCNEPFLPTLLVEVYIGKNFAKLRGNLAYLRDVHMVEYVLGILYNKENSTYSYEFYDFELLPTGTRTERLLTGEWGINQHDNTARNIEINTRKLLCLNANDNLPQGLNETITLNVQNLFREV